MLKKFKLYNDDEARLLFGNHDEYLRIIEDEFCVKIVARGENLAIDGDEAKTEKAVNVFSRLLALIRSDRPMKRQDVRYPVKALSEDSDVSLKDIYKERIEVLSKKLFVIPKTKGQRDYISAIKDYDITIAVGPAGTGKTYLAMAMAVSALKLN